MTEVPESFTADLEVLHRALRDVLQSRLSDERARILSEIFENQIKGIHLFYALLLSQNAGKLTFSESEFDLLIQKYLAVLRYFTKLPKPHPESTYNLTLISDLYYFLRKHTSEWGE